MQGANRILWRIIDKRSIKKLDYQERLEILSEMKLSDVAGQGCRKLHGGLRVREVVSHKDERRIGKDGQL